MEINVLCQLHACLYENAHEAFKLSNSSKLYIDYDTRTVDQLLNGNDGKGDFLPINKKYFLLNVIKMEKYLQISLCRCSFINFRNTSAHFFFRQKDISFI